MSKISKLHHLGIVVVLALLATILHPFLLAAQNASSATSSKPPGASVQPAGGVSLDELKLKRSEVEASQNLEKASKDISSCLLKPLRLHSERIP